MAKQIDNSYVGDSAGNPDFTSGLSRTNPQAHAPQNLVQLYNVRKSGGCSLSPTWTYVYDESADTLTITPTGAYNATGLRFWKHRIIDENGTEVYGVQASIGTNTTIVIDTSTLNPNKTWRMEFSAETLNGGLHCTAGWWLKFPAGWGLADRSGSGSDI